MQNKNMFKFQPSIPKRFLEIISHTKNIFEYADYLEVWEHIKSEGWMSEEEIKMYENEYINFNQRQKELDKISEDMKFKQHEMFINNQPVMHLN